MCAHPDRLARLMGARSCSRTGSRRSTPVMLVMPLMTEVASLPCRRSGIVNGGCPLCAGVISHSF